MILAGCNETDGVVLRFPPQPRTWGERSRRVLWRSTALAALLLAASWCVVRAQSVPFQPGANPVSNQGYDAASITVGTAFNVTRAIYNGNGTACNITLTTNKGTSVQFQNVQPGQFLPVQATVVSASTCTAGTLLAIF